MGVATNCEPDLVGVPEKYLPAFRKLKQLRPVKELGRSGQLRYWKCRCPCECGNAGFILALANTGVMFAACPWECEHQKVSAALSGIRVVPMPPEMTELFGFNSQKKAEQPNSDVPPRPILIRMSDVEPRQVEWLWPNRIPKGKVTLLVGQQGLGKSFLLCWLAAQISNGGKLPDGHTCEVGSTIIITDEDDKHDTIRPRLDGAGADVTKIVKLEGQFEKNAKGKDVETAFTLANIATLEAALQSEPDCRLVIIDPIGSYLGAKVDAHRDNQVRDVLRPLAALASKYGVAMVLIAHRRKSTADNADDTVLGSRAFTAFVRSVIHCSIDPEDTADDPNDRRRLVQMGKFNVARAPRGLAFRITPDGRIEWDSEPVCTTANDTMAAESRVAAEARKPGPKAEQRSSALEWLRGQLASGEPKRISDLHDAAEARGYGWSTVRRAADELVVVSSGGRGGLPGVWRLCANLPPASEEDGLRLVLSLFRGEWTTIPKILTLSVGYISDPFVPEILNRWVAEGVAETRVDPNGSGPTQYRLLRPA